MVNQSRPESVGCIHINSRDPDQAPVIQANYLQSETDRETMIRGLRLIVDIFESAAVREFVTYYGAAETEAPRPRVGKAELEGRRGFLGISARGRDGCRDKYHESDSMGSHASVPGPRLTAAGTLPRS